MTEDLHADATRVLARWTAPDDEQERLRTLYLSHLAGHPTAMLRECHPDHLTASAIVIARDGNQVVLTKHRKAGLWLQTGGHCESDDATLAGAALREATEESGIADLQIDPVPLLLSRHEVPFCGPVQPGHHLDVQFMVVAPDGAEPVISQESDALRWCSSDDPPEPTDQDVRDLIAAARRRLTRVSSRDPRRVASEEGGELIARRGIGAGLHDRAEERRAGLVVDETLSQREHVGRVIEREPRTIRG